MGPRQRQLFRDVRICRFIQANRADADGPNAGIVAGQLLFHSGDIEQIIHQQFL
jgi:hypothetical protein